MSPTELNKPIPTPPEEPFDFMKNTSELKEYSKLDHSHCWQSENPPCGQKIKHFECCLCKELNPEISSTIESCIPEEKMFKTVLPSKTRLVYKKLGINQDIPIEYSTDPEKIYIRQHAITDGFNAAIAEMRANLKKVV